MRHLALSIGLALTFALAAPAVAHDEGEDGGAAYDGTGCGGRYTSPYTGAHWLDCYADQDRVEVRVTWDRITYFDVYRYYAHIRNGEYSHHTWRYVYTFQ